MAQIVPIVMNKLYIQMCKRVLKLHSIIVQKRTYSKNSA